MDDPIEVALRKKRDSSMRVAVAQLKPTEGAAPLAQAAVSAGNTGALMAVSRYVLKTFDGIDRPAIASAAAQREGSASRRCWTSAPTSTARPSTCCSSR